MRTRLHLVLHIAAAAICATTAVLTAQEGQPTFRGGVDLVRVDVLVTDRAGAPVTDLTADDFEIIEDGRPQAIEQFKLVETDGTRTPGDPPAPQIRDRDTEFAEASREDVRIVGILLADYQVCWEFQATVRDALVRFVRTELGPNDLVAVVDPLESVRTLLFTHDHEEVISAIRRFEGRKGEYTPRNAVEEAHWRYLPRIESVRNAIVRDALKALAVRLGSMREGRKSLIFVSEGFPSLQGSTYLQLREIAQEANRHNVSVYALDPRGLAAGMPAPATSARRGCSGRVSRRTQETLRYLAEETDGRAIVNTNVLADGLAQIVRDASVYYLLGYSSTASRNDGAFHQIRVRVKRPGVEVRARKGYWAPTLADVMRAASPTPDLPSEILDARATIAEASREGRSFRTWVGTSRGADGLTRVTVSWEPMRDGDRAAGDQPGHVSVTAANAEGETVFAGDAPVLPTPQQLVFDSPPGELDLRLEMHAATGEAIDRDAITLRVPDFTFAEVALSTARVFPTRTALEFRAAAGDGSLAPSARREFLRTERLLIRFDAYGAGDDRPEITAALLNQTGTRLADVPIAAAHAGGTHQINFGLGALAAGEYLIEITATGDGEAVTELVAFRLGT